MAEISVSTKTVVITDDSERMIVLTIEKFKKLMNLYVKDFSDPVELSEPVSCNCGCKSEPEIIESYPKPMVWTEERAMVPTEERAMVPTEERAMVQTEDVEVADSDLIGDTELEEIEEISAINKIVEKIQRGVIPEYIPPRM